MIPSTSYKTAFLTTIVSSWNFQGSFSIKINGEARYILVKSVQTIAVVMSTKVLLSFPFSIKKNSIAFNSNLKILVNDKEAVSLN